jgi:hypothetical protein
MADTGCSTPARPARRRAVRCLLGLALLAALGAAPEAAAIRQWCRTDPVVAVDGQPADVFVAAPPDAPTRVTGPTRIEVAVPPGVDAVLVASTLGFGQGEEVAFDELPALAVTEQGIEVRVRVYVPADDAMPVLVEFAPRVVGVLAPASAEGTANAWVVLKAML